MARCAYCSTPVESSQGWGCPACGVLMHDDCHGEMPWCPTYGCEHSIHRAPARGTRPAREIMELVLVGLGLGSPVIAIPSLGACVCMTLCELRDSWYQHLIIPAVVSFALAIVAALLQCKLRGARSVLGPWIFCVLCFGFPLGYLVGSGYEILHLGSAGGSLAPVADIPLGLVVLAITTAVALPLVLVVTNVPGRIPILPGTTRTQGG